MTILTVKLSTINAPENNPRKSIHKDALEGLANSIKKDGLLQNLVVAPMKGKKYRIISGERRYRALQLLLNAGDITNEYEVPVEVRKNLSKHDKLRIATVENVQREKLPPMDEAEAFTTLAQKGVSLDDLAAQTGFAIKTIKRRLALASLCEEAKQALRDNLISLSIAEALTIGSEDDQRALLEQREGYNFTADAIREHLVDQKPSVSLAIFPLEEYQGTLTKDLFADEDSTFFDDEEQFILLQGKAVSQQVEQYKEKGVAFVEVTEGYSITRWHYSEAEEGESAGVVINLSPRGEVEVLENVMKHNMDEETAEETIIQAKPRAFYSAPLCRNMALHKSMAVQAELLAHPNLCKIISILGLLRSRAIHDCLKEFGISDIQPQGYTVINEAAKGFLDLLPSIKNEDGSSCWSALKSGHIDVIEIYTSLLTFDDMQLDQLQALLTVMTFGQTHCNDLDKQENSLFNRIAQDINVDMVNHWRPDTEFLKRRNKDQLIQISKDSGANTRLAMLNRYKKSELVTVLDSYFTRVSQEENPVDDDLKALSWLPEAMQFPAIDVMEQEEAA